MPKIAPNMMGLASGQAERNDPAPDMATQVYVGLKARGVPEHLIPGIMGNMHVESAGLQTDVNEFQPLVPGSAGGYGLNQWTGPRRRQFEAFARKRGLPPSDLETQLDFTLWELRNSERRAGDALFSASTPEEAARIYSERFLRPGIPHMDNRLKWTREYAQRFGGSSPEGTIQGLGGGLPPDRQAQGSQQPSMLALASRAPALAQHMQSGVLSAPRTRVMRDQMGLDKIELF